MIDQLPLLFEDEEFSQFCETLRKRVGGRLDKVPRMTSETIKEFDDLAEDPETNTSFSLVLAAIQIELGRVEEWVKADAKRVLADQDRYLQQWDQPGERKRRAAELKRLAAKLDRFCVLVEE